MAYPAVYTRLVNFLRDQLNGLVSPAPAKLDAELNGIQLTLSQQGALLRNITTSDGKLRNVAQAIASALAGTWAGTSDGTTTVVTTIPWVSTYSVNTILLMQGNTLLRPAQITSVQDNGSGFLRVNLAVAPTLSTTLTVWAFEPGAGILARLQSGVASDGASLVAIHDAGNFYGAVTVEGALAEVAGSVFALQTALGDLADYFKRDGSVVATGDFDMGGFKIANAADGVDLGDYVTLRQVANYISAWTDLSRFYLKRDGTTAMAGPMNFGNNKGYNLADPDLNSPLDAVNVRSLQRVVSTSGASPVGIVVPYLGSTAPDNWLLCDGQAYKSDAYPLLSNLMGAAYRSGPAQGCIAAQFASLVAGNLTAGVLTTLPPLLEAGMGYTGAPLIQAVSPAGVVYATQPTFAVTVSVADQTSPPTVVGGMILTVTIVSGGAGLEEGASLVVLDALSSSPTSPAFAQLPSGYFRTPDLRGRIPIGAGTVSKSPGIIDPPSLSKGDEYDAVTRTLGEFGGAEAHRLTIDQMPRHSHNTQSSGNAFRERDGGNGIHGGTGENGKAGGDEAHPNVPPYHVLNFLVKAQ